MSSRMDRYSHQHLQQHENSSIEAKNHQQYQRPMGPRPQPKKKKRKKKRIFRKILLTLIVLLACTVGYSYYGYQKGLKDAKNDKDIAIGKEEKFNGQKSSDGSVNILLLGSDSRGEDQGRSDTIIVANFKKDKKKTRLISFMRDTYVNIPEYGYNKINAAYSYGGAELVRQTLKKNFDIDIQYYAIVNFQSFPKIVDTLCPDGVEINAEKSLNLDGVDINQGEQKMNGNELLIYSRFRKDEEGDFGRVRRQQQVMNAVFKQTVNVNSLFHLPEAVGNVRGYTITDIPTSFYLTMGQKFITGKSNSVEKLVIPVENSWQNMYYDGAGSVLDIDEQMNRDAVSEFLVK